MAKNTDVTPTSTWPAAPRPRSTASSPLVHPGHGVAVGEEQRARSPAERLADVEERLVEVGERLAALEAQVASDARPQPASLLQPRAPVRRRPRDRRKRMPHE